MRVVFLTLIVMVVLSCNKENRCDCLKSTGSITIEERGLQDFQSIKLEDNINLYITQDTFCAARVEGGDHLLKSIKTEVSEGCLHVKNENKCNWVRSYKEEINVYLTCKSLKGLEYYKASGNVYMSDTLHTDFFQLDDWDGSGSLSLVVDAKSTSFKLHTGPADLKVQGYSESNYLYAIGNGSVDLSALRTDVSTIISKSTTSCYVNVSHELDVQIGYIGDVYFTGNPYKITSNITDLGKLIKY